ncbi:MAG: hypothetical protein FWH10_02170 [Oscillospiraceae bacterium]|nr:hypothetical protein [Oscillospiraceae bacterium]
MDLRGSVEKGLYNRPFSKPKYDHPADFVGTPPRRGINKTAELSENSPLWRGGAARKRRDGVVLKEV